MGESPSAPRAGTVGGVRQILATASLTLLALGAFGSGSAHASCAPAVRWHQVTYLGMGGPAEGLALPAAGAALSGGVVPGCNDTVVTGLDGRPLSPTEPDTAVDLRRVRNVPAALAVMTTGPYGGLYLAPGYLPQLASHPLHRLFRPNAGRGCGSATRLTGTVSGQPASALGVRAGSRLLDVLVQRRTAVRAPLRAGQPRLRNGDRVRLSGRACAGSAFVARSISRL